MLRSAISAFTRVVDAPLARLRASLTRYDLRRGALLIRGPSLALLWVPALRCIVRTLRRVRDTSGICSRCRAVICPSGGLLTGVSSPLCKNISVSVPPKSHLELLASHPKRGAYHDRHGRRGGVRWTRQSFAEGKSSLPGADKPDNREMTVAREPGHRG